MNKILRSVIHEKFPYELRVELEFLSRRRDIINKEKQDELFAIFRKYDVGDVVALGSGTNRFGIKLDGYAIKIALDLHGKIDNQKEFKMSKRLFPYVIKIHEVSKNGTILVSEYIQPFDTYTEMLQYQDRIRNILKKLSSVYLIGDVGITDKNFGNWGIRIGTDNPTCLDFAYVYEVKSSLFTCEYCKSNSVLIPNRDYTDLYCSNPSCGRKVSFEDIRTKIGNDLHRHEIGDLTQEGYELYESFVKTELTTTRSNYLIKKDTSITPKNEIKEEISYPKFVMSKSLN